MELEADGACLGASCHDVEKPTVTSLDTVPMAVRMHMQWQVQGHCSDLQRREKAQPVGQQGRIESPDRVPRQRDEQGPSSRRDVRPSGQIEGCSGGQGQALVGKQRGGDPARPRAEGRHTIKDLVFPINFSTDTALDKEQSYTTIFFMYVYVV